MALRLGIHLIDLDSGGAGTSASIDVALATAVEFFARFDLELRVESRIVTQGPLNVLVPEVGNCVSGELTSDLEQLHNMRGSRGPTDLVIYRVAQTSPSFKGCAVHPRRQPGLLITRAATPWTMAHEVAHVLGLGHVSNSENLMFRNTSRHEHPPPPAPNLNEEQVQLLTTSSLVISDDS